MNWSDIKNKTPPIVPEIKSPDRVNMGATKKFEEKEYKEPFISKREELDECQVDLI